MGFSYCRLLIFAIALTATPLEAKARKPHIVFILADDLGWNDIGYHRSELQTPNLDSLAESGVKLENYYVQPKCSATRGQLMTGRYQIHTGLQSNNLPAACPCGLPLQFPTLAEKLKQHAYATHIVGKWHLGYYKQEYLPTSRGFDSHYGYYTSSEDYNTHQFKDTLDFHLNGKPVWKRGYSTELYRQRAVELIEEHASRIEQTPLFLFLAFQAPHEPLQAPHRYWEQCSHIKDKTRRIYAAMVTALDEAIGNIKRSLEESGLWDDTLLIFSTDNGGTHRYGGNNWPLRGKKGNYWEGGIRGVGFVSGPFLSRESATSHELMHVSDWFPTLVGLAGGDTSGMGLDGYNVWNSIKHGETSARTEILHNINPLWSLKGNVLDSSPFDNRQMAAIRVGKWKLLTGAPGRVGWIPPPDHLHLNASFTNDAELLDGKNLWLFDLDKDPYEMNDLSAARPDIVTMMLEKLAVYEDNAVEPIVRELDPAGRPGPGNVFSPWE